MIILSMWNCVYARFLVKLKCFPACNMLKRLWSGGFIAKSLMKFSNTLLLSGHIVFCPKLERTLQCALGHLASHMYVLIKLPRQCKNVFAANGE